jgi:hypothetical protein
VRKGNEIERGERKQGNKITHKCVYQKKNTARRQVRMLESMREEMPGGSARKHTDKGKQKQL